MKKPYYNLEQRQLIHLNTSIGAFMQFHLAYLNFGRVLEKSECHSEVAVTCSTCKWQYAKYEYKCESCCAGDSQWEQDTDC